MNVVYQLFPDRSNDELWLYGDRISPGMAQEVALAIAFGVSIIPKTEETKIALEALRKNYL
jgi:hypothetical protein